MPHSAVPPTPAGTYSCEASCSRGSWPECGGYTESVTQCLAATAWHSVVDKRALPHFLILKDDSVLVAGLHMYNTRIDWCHQHTVGTGNLCQLLCCVIKGSDGTLQHAWRLQHCKRLPPGAGDIRKAR